MQLHLNELEAIIAQVPIWVRLLWALVPATGLAYGIWRTRSDVP